MGPAGWWRCERSNGGGRGIAASIIRGRAADNPSDECVTTVCAGRVEIDAKKSQKVDVKGVCGGDTHTMVDRSEQLIMRGRGREGNSFSVSKTRSNGGRREESNINATASEEGGGSRCN